MVLISPVQCAEKYWTTAGGKKQNKKQKIKKQKNEPNWVQKK